MEATTTDISKFGNREKQMAATLLNECCKGLPDDFYNNEVSVMMNINSGSVFLTNSEYQVAMMNGDKLESFYSCSECGHEGFADEMSHNPDNVGCQEYLTQIKGV